MTGTTLRIGIVGCGGIARAHLTGYAKMPDVQIAAVYDVNKAMARKMAEETGASVAATVDQMIAKYRLDAVSVCTPPAFHLDVCRPFLSAGVAVLCEKPLESNYPRARQLVSAVNAGKSIFMTAYCHRFHPAVIELKRLIKDGVLGKPVFFRNIFGGYFQLKGNHRAKPELSGGGSIIDNCSHSVDLYRFLVGEPTEVQAFAGNILQKASVEDIGLLHLSNDGRVFGEITSSYSLKVCGNWVEWYGTLGTAIVSYWNENQPDLVYRRETDQAWTSVDCSAHPDRFQAEIAHFVQCVRSGTRPAVTAHDGLRTSQVISAAYTSIAKGRKVSIKSSGARQV